MYNDTLVISGNHINIEDVCRVSKREVKLELSSDRNFFNRINDGYKFLEELLAREGKIYGVTTGYGDSVNRGVPIDLVDQLPINLTRFHGCGLGQNFNIEEGAWCPWRGVIQVCATNYCSSWKPFCNTT
jgi:histidine ammonia-lyase